MTEKDGSWKIGFWVMATLCVGGMVTLGSNVIANDRIRFDQDSNLRNYVDVRADRNQMLIGSLMKENQEAHESIRVILARISERLGVKDDEIKRVM
jgi:hypothetical protein